MTEFAQQPLYSFSATPPVGEDNWQFAFATAQVRALEDTFLGKALLVEMINAPNFEAALECLSGTDYGEISGIKTLPKIEAYLLEKRTEVRQLTAQQIGDFDELELIKARIDFANLRLALRRLVMEQPIGVDYSQDGYIPADKFEDVLEHENYIEFPLFLQEAVEMAVLKYYQDKDICQIDYGIDIAAAQYSIKRAKERGNVFMLEFFRMQIDLDNIRTMARLKNRNIDRFDSFLPCGYVDKTKLTQGLDAGWDSMGALFIATPYYNIVEAGCDYFSKHNSFLRLEQLCDNYMLSFLRSTSQLTAGPEPAIAYMLRKENEIRNIRMILTGKKNNLDSQMLLDRLPETQD